MIIIKRIEMNYRHVYRAARKATIVKDEYHVRSRIFRGENFLGLANFSLHKNLRDLGDYICTWTSLLYCSL